MSRRLPVTESDPWFVRRPLGSLLMAALLFIAVTALQFVHGNDLAAGITMLYVLPVSLVALARGGGAGVVAGAVGTVLLVSWVEMEDVAVDAVGYLSRTVPLFLVGYLLGDAADRLRGANRWRVANGAAAVRHRQAVEVNDLLVQGMVAAKWSFEAGRHEVGLQTLEDTIATGQDLVSRLIADAGGAQRVMK